MFNLRKDYQGQEKGLKNSSTAQPANINLLEPKLIEINGHKFIISKMPCTVAQEVVLKLPAGFIPMVSNFAQSQEMAFKMLSYCERVYSDGRANVPLISKEIIDNHVPDFNTLVQLEYECINYNYDFFAQGKVWDFLNKGLSLAESKASAILTDLLDKLLSAGVQLSTNLEQSTH
jgi:hypothetical protein